MKLPTHLGKTLLLDCFKARMEEPLHATDVVGQFQRMALVGTIEDAVDSVRPFFKISHREIADGSPEWTAIELCYRTCKQDVLGLAVDCLVGIVNSSAGATKEKIAASAILNELYGEKQLITDEKLTDRLVVDLVGKG